MDSELQKALAKFVGALTDLVKLCSVIVKEEIDANKDKANLEPGVQRRRR